MENKKINIGIDKNARDFKIRKLTLSAKEIFTFKSDLEQYDIKLNKASFEDIVCNGAIDTIKQINDAVEADLKNISFAGTKEVIKANANSVIENIKELHLDYKHLSDLLNYGEIGDNGVFVFNGNYKNQIEDECTLYLTDQKEIAFHAQQMKVIKEFQKLKDMIDDDNKSKLNPVQLFNLVLTDNGIGFKQLPYQRLVHGIRK
ncbi:hypothetical protein [Plebeiibacterium sediminum]|uniref:Uncharacterized protein n=1 Tax=Plebeiibacterium sediminum TaxID=2992112 RepID=A0AAE3M3Z7_9BACT|nr:hypothetical protein [Plebeiobacterium sediminum]MCW3786836.1 hypothetical protein [Plebeiobacterium sediminum]